MVGAGLVPALGVPVHFVYNQSQADHGRGWPCARPRRTRAFRL